MDFVFYVFIWSNHTGKLVLFCFGDFSLMLLHKFSPCQMTYRDPLSNTLYSYSLSSLSYPSTETAKFFMGFEGGIQDNTFAINIAGDASRYVGEGKGCSDPTPMCELDKGGTFNSCGSLSSWTLQPYHEPGSQMQEPLKGMIATISRGTVCASTGEGRQSVFYLQCDATKGIRPVPPPGAVNDMFPVTESSPCVYNIHLVSKCFCPMPNGCPSGNMTLCGGLLHPPSGSPKLTVDWIVLICVISVLSCFLLYFFVGYLILKFALHREGNDTIPNYRFWAACYRRLTCKGKYSEI